MRRLSAHEPVQKTFDMEEAFRKRINAIAGDYVTQDPIYEDGHVEEAEETVVTHSQQDKQPHMMPPTFPQKLQTNNDRDVDVHTTYMDTTYSRDQMLSGFEDDLQPDYETDSPNLSANARNI